MGAFALDWTAMVTIASKPAPRPYVDFSSVPPSQWSIHDRLENWARWSRGASGERARMVSSPMFGLYRSSEARNREYGSETSVPIDHKDATRIHVGVTALPDKHRRALQWSYLVGKNPSAAARDLAVTHERLAQLVREGRLMLINRGV